MAQIARIEKCITQLTIVRKSQNRHHLSVKYESEHLLMLNESQSLSLGIDGAVIFTCSFLCSLHKTYKC